MSTAAATPALLVGPMLRFVGETEATIWIETDRACEIQVLTARSRTFEVAGHHYGLVCVQGLEPGTAYEYEVRLDGQQVWPLPDSSLPGPSLPPSRIRTLETAVEHIRIAFGSCRIDAPHEPPYVLPHTRRTAGRGIDALRTYALELLDTPPSSWPDLLLLVGDQLYADDLSPELARVTRSARPGQGRLATELVTFDEFALAYRESWSEPMIRWLLSTVPSSMIFDDHEVLNAWKSSQAWLERMRAQDWYGQRVGNALMAYWLYQHLGNLSPAELADNALLNQLGEAGDGENAEAALREFALQADREPGHSHWSFVRRLGRSRLVVLDSRAGRELTPGARRMLEAGEWGWAEDQADGVDGHLLLASSVPLLVGRGLHEFEVWNEAVCDGRWGPRAARVGEWLRQNALLDHWAAFDRSFRLFAGLIRDVVTGRRGTPPASVLVLSGDVHHCYTARVRFPARWNVTTPVWQLVCSPLRMYFPHRQRLLFRFAESRSGALLGRAIRALAGLPAPPLEWELVDRPSLDNQIATLDLRGPRAVLRIATTAGSDWRRPALHTVLEHELNG